MRASRWLRHLVYRTEVVKTTWKLRLALVVVVALVLLTTRGPWTRAIGRSLTCADDARPGDAIVVENFEPDYLLFERAATLQRAGLSAHVVVPTEASAADPAVPNAISLGIVELLIRVARVDDVEIVPAPEIEPITLNVAYRVRDALVRARARTVILVAPAFRSRRSLLVYRTVLAPAGISVSCAPVPGPHTAETWTRSWHGIQDVVQQFVKLQFYRFYVLPRSSAR